MRQVAGGSSQKNPEERKKKQLVTRPSSSSTESQGCPGSWSVARQQSIHLGWPSSQVVCAAAREIHRCKKRALSVQEGL